MHCYKMIFENHYYFIIMVDKNAIIIGATLNIIIFQSMRRILLSLDITIAYYYFHYFRNFDSFKRTYYFLCFRNCWNYFSFSGDIHCLYCLLTLNSYFLYNMMVSSYQKSRIQCQQNLFIFSLNY